MTLEHLLLLAFTELMFENEKQSIPVDDLFDYH
jgi:hypothetical protein